MRIGHWEVLEDTSCPRDEVWLCRPIGCEIQQGNDGTVSLVKKVKIQVKVVNLEVP